MSKHSVRDRLRVVAVPKGRVLLLDAPQFLLRAEASDRRAVRQHVNRRQESVVQTRRAEHVAVVGDIEREREGDGPN
jgi:hypothetical protein